MYASGVYDLLYLFTYGVYMYIIVYMRLCIILRTNTIHIYVDRTIHGMLSSLGICIIYVLYYILYIYRVMIAYRV